MMKLHQTDTSVLQIMAMKAAALNSTGNHAVVKDYNHFPGEMLTTNNEIR